MASVVAIPVHDSEMNVYLDGPERRSPGPAVILMFHRGGVDGFTRGVVERLVAGGYLVAVPDVYHRSPRRCRCSTARTALRTPKSSPT